MRITLHQFPYSHYNEKARWALALKQIPHERVNYLPGPHMRAIRKLSGQNKTPVLDWDGEIIAGSTAILRHIDKAAPEPPLFPERHAAEIDTLVTWLDDEVGPATRTLLFSVMIEHGGYLTHMFSHGKNPWQRALYRASFPLVKGLIARGNGVNPENVQRSERIARNAMDVIASRATDTGYLCGDGFTAADLTAAALLAPLASPSHPDMRRPEPVPAALRDLFETWSTRPAIAWVNQIYHSHRTA